MQENAKNPARDFNRLYKDVSDNIAKAMKEIEGLDVEHKDGKQELGNMMDKLRGIQRRFDGELALLEKHAEWDKFTLAFFGETNAGKSTIIESLRILFKEESRQKLLQENAQDLARYEQALAAHVNQVRDGLNTVYAQYAAEIGAINSSAAALSQVLREETSSRVKRKLWLCAVSGLGVGSVATVALTRFMGG